MRPFLFFIGAAFTLGSAVGAPEQRFTSGPNRVSLIELYTSEGCSSCPPAERWLGSLNDAPGLWRDFVPMALHVNYWDRLGWRDRFASPEFTQRQQAYATKWASNSVYTPCFVRDGKEWRAPSRFPTPSSAKTGILTTTLGGDGRIVVEFSLSAPKNPGEAFEIHVAVLGNGFSSKVTAGENRGVTLRHQFVALALQTYPFPPISDERLRSEVMLPPPAISDASRRAIAVWVTRRGELDSLQATGGWLLPSERI
ncbi:MAG: DUF1223 domain-containing protein [Opitutaceae bacterium]